MERQTRVTVDAVDLPRLVRFPSLLSSITVAMRGSRVVTGALAILVLACAGRVWDAVATPTISPYGLLAGSMTPEQAERSNVAVAALQEDLARVGDAAGPGARQRTLRMIDMQRPKGCYEALATEVSRATCGAVRNMLALEVPAAIDDVWTLCTRVPVACWRASVPFSITFGALTLIVLGFSGGVIARLAAFDLGAGEQPPLAQARAFVRDRWTSVCFAPFAALAVAAILLLATALPGLMLRVPGLDVLAALWGGVGIVLSLLAGILLLLLIVAAPLFVPAAAIEACDGTEAVQRVSAMLLSKPLHAALYAGVGLVTFAVGFAIVDAALAWSYNTSFGLLTDLAGDAWGNFDPRLSPLEPAGWVDLSSLSGTGRVAGEVAMVWRTVVSLAIGGYAMSLFWTIGARAYLLQRLAADGDPTDRLDG
ncbi:MAG: hypothetical protein O2819_02315 [Planctomycetota bacterium]|nr:hypothetical protein [Planctomycetota bacterium]MDA1106489.1 hypothetical protein [Planctomycetota bacterium]